MRPCPRWNPRYLLRPPCAGSLLTPWDAPMLAGERWACGRAAPARREGRRAADTSAYTWRTGARAAATRAHYACANMWMRLTRAPSTRRSRWAAARAARRCVATARKRVQGSPRDLLCAGGTTRLSNLGFWHTTGGAAWRCAMGRRQACKAEGCSKGAIGSTQYCAAHGGGRRCQEAGCTKAAQGGGTHHCVEHGGGSRCQKDGCTKSNYVAHRAGYYAHCPLL